MNTIGQICLLAAFVGSGYAAFACLASRRSDRRRLESSGLFAGASGVAALTAAFGVLTWALLAKDFRFAYVMQYSSRLLPWHYSLSALWVGQAGSLLLWAWFLGVIAVLFRFWPRREPNPLRETAFGVLMAYQCFLVAIMIFAADPMAPIPGVPADGDGLSPALQHPAMLTHPPIVFLGYAAWAVPFALALAALVGGDFQSDWRTEARWWAVGAWTVLGGSILWGAAWAYEELGWGGYWSWDPVENGSLIPWLTGTALIHALTAWQHSGTLKKTSLALAIATFALCNFATFLTRSGIFSSLHAFSQSPIGWMFLAMMAALVACGILVPVRRASLTPDRPISSLWARESLIAMSVVALLLLATVALLGTLSGALSNVLLGRKIIVGTAFYNNALIPIGLLVLALTAVAPPARWGAAFSDVGKKMLLLASGLAAVAVALAAGFGVRNPVALAVSGLAALAVASPLTALFLNVRRRKSEGPWRATCKALKYGRRQYAGFLIHLGFVFLAVGVTGSSLGTRQHDAVMAAGDTIEWQGWSIRCARLIERALPDKLVAEAELKISRAGAAGGDGSVATLLPARHLHLLPDLWTTEAAIHSTWSGDLYAVANGSAGEGEVSLTFIRNPLMRWMWFGGWVCVLGAVIRLWPARRFARLGSAVPPPKFRRAFSTTSTTPTALATSASD